MFISPSDPRLIYCGRIDFDNPDAPVMVYPSSYVTFRFTGNFLKVKLTNKRSCWSNRMGCVIDGVQTALLLYEGMSILFMEKIILRSRTWRLMTMIKMKSGMR